MYQFNPPAAFRHSLGAMPMKSKTCILCGAAPTTAAHLFASAIRNEFPNERSLVYRMREPIDPSRYRRVSQRVGSGIMHVQPKVLCQSCNGSWMNGIEQVAAPPITGMIRGEDVVLTWEHQTAIAEWALAVAILRAETVPGSHSFDPVVARKFRREGWKGTESVGIWIARVERTLQGVRSNSATTYLRGGAADIVGAAMLLWLRQVCVIVAQEPYLSSFEPGLRGLALAARRIPTPEPIGWPLERSVLDQVLLDRLQLGDQMTQQFLDVSQVERGRRTEQVLRIREDMPADDLAVEVMKRRLVAAEQSLCLDAPKQHLDLSDPDGSVRDSPPGPDDHPRTP